MPKHHRYKEQRVTYKQVNECLKTTVLLANKGNIGLKVASNTLTKQIASSQQVMPLSVQYMLQLWV